MTNILCIFSKKKDFEHMGPYSFPVTFFGYDSLVADPAFTTKRLDIYKEASFRWLIRYPIWILWRPFELLFYRLTGVGFALGQILHHRRYINTFDIVYGINDTSGIPLSLLKRLHLIKPPVVFVSAGLINNMYAHPRDPRTHLLRFALCGATCVFAWSPHEQHLFEAWGISSTHLPLEADTRLFSPDPSIPREDFILFSGRDIGRDTATLIEVLKETGLPAVFITNRSLLPKGELPANITLITDYISYDELKNYYNRARLVVVPVKEIGRFSGQTSLLEALAMGKATIAARTKACTSAYPTLTGNTHLLWYEPENERDLKEKVLALHNDPSMQESLGEHGREFVELLPQEWLYTTLKKNLFTFAKKLRTPEV